MKTALHPALAVTFLTLAALQSPAHAQATRVFVAAQGSDSQPCTFALPCRTFQHAHDVVAANGEVDVLDPAGYGAVTVTKSVSFQGHGFAGISVAAGGTGITINAGATDKINIRGVLLEGSGSGSMGITFNTGGSLTVVESVIRDFTANGFNFVSSTGGALIVSNTVISDNGGAAIFMDPSGSFHSYGAFTRVEAYNNAQFGIRIIASLLTSSSFRVNAKAVDCVLQNMNGLTSSSVGASVSSTGGDITLTLYRSAISGFSNGAIANDAHSSILIAQSSFEGAGNNSVGGTGIFSYGDNYLGGDLATVNNLSTR